MKLAKRFVPSRTSATWNIASTIRCFRFSRKPTFWVFLFQENMERVRERTLSPMPWLLSAWVRKEPECELSFQGIPHWVSLPCKNGETVSKKKGIFQGRPKEK